MEAKRRHLLYLSAFDPTVTTTGTTTRGHNFLRYLVDHYQVHVVHLSDPHEGNADHALLGKLATCTSVRYSSPRHFLFSRKLLKAASAAIESAPVEGIFADSEKAGAYAYLLARRYGLRYFYNAHNVEYQRQLSLARLGDPRRLVLAPYVYLAERLACAGSELSIAISESDANKLRRWKSAEDVLVMPAAFDDTVFHPFYEDVHTAYPIILMVGNFRYPANREGAMAIWHHVLPRVLERTPNAVFRFIGMGFPEEIRHPNVQAPGYVSDLPREYRRAAAVVVPIYSGGGIKIKAIEALACGRHVIATPAALEGIARNDMHFVHIGEVADFPDLLNEALNHPQRHTTVNWAWIQRNFGTRKQLAALKDMMNDRLMPLAPRHSIEVRL